ncbi:LysR family transcriptional regulator [Pseudomonas sp. EL_65y_Pfl2_R95]|uniref:LysR family transcriptional regulator n=1 Tax=Pseudomonas sp. EL_65y_Pfl2_R95 TaxID=3088698 RepID=UPI0030DD39FC
MSISLRQLKIFEATARLGRLTAAADDQAISQSAASQALRELESGLGYPLFHRIGRDLLITDAGRAALPKVGLILQTVDNLIHSPGGAISGTLRVAASLTIASYLLPKLLSSFIHTHDQVDPDVRISNTEAVISAVEKGQVHLGLIEGPALHSQLCITPWCEDQLQVFCRPDHPLAAVGKLSAEQICEQRWVLREPGSGTRAVFDAAVQQVSGQVKLALALNRQEAIKQSVKAGLGIGCLSGLSIADQVAAGDLVILQTPLELRRRFSLITQPLHEGDTLAQAFIAHLQQSTSSVDN